MLSPSPPFSKPATANAILGSPVNPPILDKYQDEKYAYVLLAGISRQRGGQMMLDAKVCPSN